MCPAKSPMLSIMPFYITSVEGKKVEASVWQNRIKWGKCKNGGIKPTDHSSIARTWNSSTPHESIVYLNDVIIFGICEKFLLDFMVWIGNTSPKRSSTKGLIGS